MVGAFLVSEGFHAVTTVVRQVRAWLDNDDPLNDLSSGDADVDRLTDDIGVVPRVSTDLLCRRVQHHCPNCTSRTRCAGDLDARDARWQEYCPNTYAWHALVAEMPAPEIIEELIAHSKRIGETENAAEPMTKATDRSCRH